MKTGTALAPLLQAYFIDRLIGQRNASPNTIASQRDTFRLVLDFAQKSLNKPPSSLLIQDIDASFIGRFLTHLEKIRGNTPASRNVRLAAIHSFFKFVALKEPICANLAQHVLAIPSKRCKRRLVDFLTRTETNALLEAPDLTTWAGRRDRALMLVAVQTGLRVSEVINLRCQDVVLGTGAHVKCTGKGRKERSVPLRQDAVVALRNWLREGHGGPQAPLFPSARGHRLSRDGVEYLLTKHAILAQKRCSSLKGKRISPHVLRHSLAMELLQNGVDRSVIALWLGHESMDTTQIYLHADLELKEKALSTTKPYNGYPGRYRAKDKLLAFLQGL